jgi:hypothetical protein
VFARTHLPFPAHSRPGRIVFDAVRIQIDGEHYRFRFEYPPLAQTQSLQNRGARLVRALRRGHDLIVASTKHIHYSTSNFFLIGNLANGDRVHIHVKPFFRLHDSRNHQLIFVPVEADEIQTVYRCNGFIVGKAITSLIEAESVSNMHRRSIPMPTPMVGGMAYSIARMKSRSIGCASSFPAARLRA